MTPAFAPSGSRLARWPSAQPYATEPRRCTERTRFAKLAASMARFRLDRNRYSSVRTAS